MKVINEVARMQQLAGIITEIKINKPSDLDKTIENFTELHNDEDGNIDTWDIDCDVFWDVILKYPTYFPSFDNDDDIASFIDNFREKIHNITNFDDHNEWINPSLRKILGIVKTMNIDE